VAVVAVFTIRQEHYMPVLLVVQVVDQVLILAQLRVHQEHQDKETQAVVRHTMDQMTKDLVAVAAAPVLQVQVVLQALRVLVVPVLHLQY
jgi:hypothetical protein